MKINNARFIFVILLCAISTVQCSKDMFIHRQRTSQEINSNHRQVAKSQLMELSNAKKLFVDRGIEDKLTNTISQISKLQWKADWSKPIHQNINDSTHYLFVPLKPYIITAEGEKAATAVNTSNYLIIKNDIEYYFGSYESSKKIIFGHNVAKDNDAQLMRFTGRFVMINLESKHSISVQYENGVPKKIIRNIIGVNYANLSRLGR